MNKLTGKKKVVMAAMPSPQEDRKWRAEDAMRTIMRAEEFKRDKSLMKDVKELAKKQSQDLKKIC